LLTPRMGEGFGEAADGAETPAKELPRVLAKLSSLARLETEGECTNGVDLASHRLTHFQYRDRGPTGRRLTLRLQEVHM